MNKKLVLVFADANGKEFSLSWNYVSSELSQSNVSALITAILTNGSIFANVPVTCKSATAYDITPTSYSVN